MPEETARGGAVVQASADNPLKVLDRPALLVSARHKPLTIVNRGS